MERDQLREISSSSHFTASRRAGGGVYLPRIRSIRQTVYCVLPLMFTVNGGFDGSVPLRSGVVIDRHMIDIDRHRACVSSLHLTTARY
jgi:hypothetical protein